MTISFQLVALNSQIIIIIRVRSSPCGCLFLLRRLYIVYLYDWSGCFLPQYDDYISLRLAHDCGLFVSFHSHFFELLLSVVCVHALVGVALQVRRYDRCTAQVSRLVACYVTNGPLSQSVNKSKGACSFCLATRQVHLRDGTIHKHGPRHNPCLESNKSPLQTSTRSQISPSADSSASSAVPDQANRPSAVW